MVLANGNQPSIKLYTNHACPWAHRAHIVLKELGLPYEETIIDLGKPREPWYLELNPRGLVPTINFNGEIVTESAIVAQFLADSYPSHLLPATGSVDAALFRARIGFFVDTWFTKVNSFWFKMLMGENEEEKANLSKEFVSTIEKEIEPLLKDAKPFFGGKDKMTLAEALTAPFILRIYAMAKHGFILKSTLDGLEALPNFSKWAANVIKQESVTYIWDEEKMMASTKIRLEQLRAQANEKKN